MAVLVSFSPKKKKAASRFHENHVLTHATGFRLFPVGIEQSDQTENRHRVQGWEGPITGFYP